MIRFGSVCSGIESASVAWEPLGMSAAWFSEIEPFPCKVLTYRWPDVPNLGDMTKLPGMVRSGHILAPDVLVGGTPCQAFSVAGKQLSLDDARGQLTLFYGDLLNAIDESRTATGLDPAIAVWENVPGVLSTKDNAFGWFLGLLAGEFTLADCLSGTAQPLEAQPGESRQKWSKSGCVIGSKRTVAWRILDAQYFGVAQRRRRVFVVASARDGFDPAEVLFEREGMRRDIAPSREAGKDAATNVEAGVRCPSHWDSPMAPHPTLSQSHNTGGIGASNQEVFSQRGAGLCMVAHGTQDPCVDTERAFTLGRNNGGENVIAFVQNQRDEVRIMPYAGALSSKHGMKQQTYLAYGIPGNWIGRAPENGGNSVEPMHNLAPCLTATDRHGVSYGKRVRRLTPTEYERLQGFPDGHTAIPCAADGNRYKALGNSKAVPVVRWVGKRILDILETIHPSSEPALSRFET